MLWLLVDLFLVGLVAGCLSGLLGIGGGVVIVPGLLYVFHLEHFSPRVLMHLAAGSSFTIMIPTAWRALRSHLSLKVDFYSIYKLLVPGLVVGVIAGAIAAHFLHSNILRWVFATLMVLVACKLLIFNSENRKEHSVKRVYKYAAGSIIGFFSGMLGIGGSTFVVPFLLACGYEMRRVIVVAMACSLTTACVGCVSFLLTGMHSHGLPAWSTGYIYWPAVLMVSIGAVIVVPLGSWLSHKTSQNTLRKIFAIFLLICAFHMVFNF